MIHIIGFFGSWRFIVWFLWPFLFVFCLAAGIKEFVETSNLYNFNLWCASFSLFMMISMILSAVF